jgi:site-specific recombinase XerD
MLQNVHDIRTVPELLDHKDVKATIYTDVLDLGELGVGSMDVE